MQQQYPSPQPHEPENGPAAPPKTTSAHLRDNALFHSVVTLGGYRLVVTRYLVERSLCGKSRHVHPVHLSSQSARFDGHNTATTSSSTTKTPRYINEELEPSAPASTKPCRSWVWTCSNEFRWISYLHRPWPMISIKFPISSWPS